VLEIKGFLENSLIEWDGKIASVIFLPGCNFKCPWCHVPDLAFNSENLDAVPFWQVEEAIHRQKNWMDGIVITGGEPTIHSSLPEFIERIKEWELPVKIETNGSHPDMLRELIEEGLVDSAAMDIKNTVQSLKLRTVGVPVELEKMKESIGLLMTSGIDYEFRTTVVPAFLNEQDIEEIARFLRGGGKKICPSAIRSGECFRERDDETKALFSGEA